MNAKIILYNIRGTAYASLVSNRVTTTQFLTPKRNLAQSTVTAIRIERTLEFRINVALETIWKNRSIHDTKGFREEDNFLNI